MEKNEVTDNQLRREEFFAKVKACEQGFGEVPSIAYFMQWREDHRVIKAAVAALSNTPLAANHMKANGIQP